MVARLRDRVDRRPESVGIRFHGPQGWTDVRRDAQWAKTLAVAGGLRAAGVGPGDRVLMLVPEVNLTVHLLFGAWAAGAVPVQVGLPYRMSDLSAFVGGLRGLAEQTGAVRLVVSRALASFAVAGDEVVVAEDLAGLAEPLAAPLAAPGPAFLQLTSGSVSRPRAVVIGPDRLEAHLRAIAAALPAGPGDSGVSWLPLYHDMGLVGGLLYPFVTDFPVAMLSPMDFRNKPYRWLVALSELSATHTMGPPSAFALASRLARRAVRDGLDLSRLRCAMTGAEPISPQILRDFTAAFAPCGFRDEAWFPVYGLAEATVAVTFPEVLTPTRFDAIDPEALARGQAVATDRGSGAEFTGVGRPLAGVDVRIVDDQGHDLPERTIGEIRVRTEHGMEGYHDDPQGTEAAYRDGWLATGDRGYLADGILFVTGRSKELIIRAGRNLVPALVEQVAAQIDGIRAGCVVAVGLAPAGRGTERAVVVAETRTPPEAHEALAETVLEALKAEGLEVDEVRLVDPGWLPKTTSGKLRRVAVAARLDSDDPTGVQAC